MSLLTGVLISMLPFVELRLGLPIAIANASPLSAFILCVAANIIIIPFIFLFLDYAHFRLLRIKIYSKISNNILNKMRPRSVKVKEKMAIYGFPALMLFVSIPLPVTGAYAGSIIAWLLNLNRKKSFLAIAAGVTIAGIIITLLSLGIINIFNLG